MKPCECGCGVLVHRRFLRGHQARCMSDVTRTKISMAFTGRIFTPEVRKKISATLKRKGIQPSVHHLGGFRGPHSKETRKKISLAKTNPSAAIRRNLSIAARRRALMYPDLARRNGSHTDPKRIAATVRLLWKNPEYARRVLQSHRSISVPNKAELHLGRILNQFYPSEWKYVGDGQLIIAGKCPDFVNVNGQKKVIELFGDYWHRGEKAKTRARVFAPYGFKTLVVWERELKNELKLLLRLEGFYRA